MKKSLIGAGIFLVLLIVAAVVAPGFINWSEYRGQVTRIAENFTGREISINGDISFQLIPSPHLTAADVHVANVPGGIAEEFLSLDVLDLRVALLPLIAGQIQVESVILQNPVIHLERFEDGGVNWSVGSVDEQAPGQSDDNDLALNSVEVQGGRLSFVDQAKGLELDFDAIDLVLSAGSRAGPFQLQGSLTYKNEAMLFEFSLGRLREDRRSAIRIWFELAGQTPGIELNGTTMLMGETADISARIRGSGSSATEFITAAMHMVGGALTVPLNLEKAFEIDGNLNLSKTAASLNPVMITLDDTTGQGILELGFGEENNFAFSLAINSLVLEDWISGGVGDEAVIGPKPLLKTGIRDDIKGTIDLTIEALTYGQAVARQISLQGIIEKGMLDIERFGALLPGGSNLSFSGQLKDGEAGAELGGSLKLASNNLRQLLEWLGVEAASLPPRQLATFSYEGAVRLRSDVVQFFGATGQLDISDFEGGLSIGLGDRPAFGVDLRLSRLNLDSYLAGRDEPSEENERTWDQVKNELLEALKPLSGFDANITLAINNFGFRGWRAAEFETKAVLLGDSLTIHNLKISDLEGLDIELGGTAANFASDPFMDIALDITSGNLAGILRRLDLATKFDPQALRSLSLSGEIAGTFDSLNLDLEGELGRAGMVVAGSIRDPGPRPGGLDLEFSFSHADHLDLIRRFSPGWQMEGRPAPVTMSGHVAGPLDSLQADISYALLGGSGQARASIHDLLSEPSVAGTFSFSHGDLLAFVNDLGVAWSPASRRLGSLQLSVSLEGTVADFSLSDIRLEVGAVRAEGNISIVTSPELRIVRGSIAMGEIKLDHFMAPVTTGAQEVSDGTGARWSREPLNLDWMAGLDLEMTLTAQVVGYLDYRFEGLSSRLLIRNNSLNLDNFNARLMGGSMSATALLGGGDVPMISASLLLRDVSLERTLRASAAIAPATGVFNLQSQFEGAGSSQFDIISNLKGSARMSARDGVIRGFDVPAITSRLGSLRRFPDFVNLLNLGFSGGETAYRFFETSLEIDDGIMRADSLAADMDGAELSGRGVIDLPSWRINARGEIRFEDEIDEAGAAGPTEAGPSSATAAWLTDPEAPSLKVTVIGPIHAPETIYDKQELISYIGAHFATSLIGGIFGQSQNDPTPDPSPEGGEDPLGTAGGIFGLIFSLIPPKPDDDGG